jgi:RNase P protein component
MAVDLVVIGRPSVLSAAFAELEAEVEELGRRLAKLSST